MGVIVRIDRSRVTNNSRQYPIVEDSLVIESYIGQVVDTCEVVIFDKYSEFFIQSMSEIIITRDDIYSGNVDVDFPDPGEPDNRLFFGLVVHIVGEPVGFSTYWTLTCQDFTIMLDRSLVLQSYPANFKDGGYIGDVAILYNVFNSEVYSGGTDNTVGGASEILVIPGDDPSDPNQGFVDQGLKALELQIFRFSTLREVVSTLAQYVGFDFYVDYYRRLHYYYRESENADFALTDNPYSERNTGRKTSDNIPIINVHYDSGVEQLPALKYRSCSWKRDGSRLVNAFALFGDRLLSDPITVAIPSDGSNEINLKDVRGVYNYVLLPEPGNERIGISVRRGQRDFGGNNTHASDRRTVLDAHNVNFIEAGVVEGDIVINESSKAWGVIRNVGETTISASLRNGQIARTRNNIRYDPNEWGRGDAFIIPIWEDIEHVATESDPDNVEDRADVVYNISDGILEFRTVEVQPDDIASVRLRFVHNFVGGRLSPAEASITRYGRVFARREVVSDVNSAAGMEQKLTHLHEQYNYPLEVVTCVITDDEFPESMNKRFESGQWVSFENDVLRREESGEEIGPNKEYLIHKITTRILGGDLIEYELELRDWEVDLI